MRQEPSEIRRVVLEYRTPANAKVSNRAAWIVVLALGVPAGYLLSFSAYGFVCAGVLIGAIIGVANAFAARSYKVLFGLLGNSVAIVACILFATIRNARAGVPNESSDLIGAVPLLFLVVAGPGLFCGAIVLRAQTPAA